MCGSRAWLGVGILIAGKKRSRGESPLVRKEILVMGLGGFGWWEMIATFLLVVLFILGANRLGRLLRPD